MICGGKIHGRDRVRVPGTLYEKMPILNPLKDKKVMQQFQDAKKAPFDFVSVPVVQTGKDVSEVREALGEKSKVKILAKIDTLEAIQNLNTIMKQADGLIIMRQSLSILMDPEKLFIAQKWMTQTANAAAVPVFLHS